MDYKSILFVFVFIINASIGFCQEVDSCRILQSSLNSALLKCKNAKSTDERFNYVLELRKYNISSTCFSFKEIAEIGMYAQSVLIEMGVDKTERAYLIPAFKLSVLFKFINKSSTNQLTNEVKQNYVTELESLFSELDSYTNRLDKIDTTNHPNSFWPIYFSSLASYLYSCSELNRNDKIIGISSNLLTDERLMQKFLKSDQSMIITQIMLLTTKQKNMDDAYLRWKTIESLIDRSSKSLISLTNQNDEYIQRDSLVHDLYKDIEKLKKYVEQPGFLSNKSNLLLFSIWFDKLQERGLNLERLSLLQILSDFNSRNNDVAYNLEYWYQYQRILKESFMDSIAPFIRYNRNEELKPLEGKVFYNELLRSSRVLHSFLSNYKLSHDDFDSFYRYINFFINTHQLLAENDKALELSELFANLAEKYINDYAEQTIEAKIRNDFYQAYLDAIVNQSLIFNSIASNPENYDSISIKKFYKYRWNSKAKALSFRAKRENLKPNYEFRSVEDFLKSIRDDEAYIDIVHYSDSVNKLNAYCAFLINSRNRVRLIRLDSLNGNEAYLFNLFKYFNNSVDSKFQRDILYRCLWSGIDLLISSRIKTIYFSGEGIYNKINISLLFDDEGAQLVDKYFIVNKLHFRNENLSHIPISNFASDFIIFGAPEFGVKLTKTGNDESTRTKASGSDLSELGNWEKLSGAEQEISNLELLLKIKKIQYKTYEDVSATESKFRSIEEASVIHLATHGFYLRNSEILENCGFVLAGANKPRSVQGNKTDGYVLGSDIVNLKIKDCYLVFLSACETAIGFDEGLDSSYGLIAAFNIAGVKSTIGTLWAVDDNLAMRFSSSFYENLFKFKGDLRKSFKNSIDEIKKVNSDAFKWGAFVLYLN